VETQIEEIIKIKITKNSKNNNKNAQTKTAFIEIGINPKKSQKNKLLKRAEKWIKDKAKLVQRNLRALFKSQHFQKILKYLKCLKYAGKAANQINSLLKNHLTLIGDIVTKGYIGRIPLYIVNIICSWEHFKKVADEFVKGFQKKDITEKFFYYGQLVGKFLRIIGSNPK